jgi:DNA-binding CsgD family transcriptional regulator
MHSERGRAREFRRALYRAHVPMVTASNDRRLLDGNLASRLLLNLSLGDLKRHRVDDVVGSSDLVRLPDSWQRLLERGELVGMHELSLGGGLGMRVMFVALANILPGEHLIVLAPADWPGEELVDSALPTPSPAGVLSTREQQVLGLVAAGASLREIAEQLAISEATVRTHLGNANRKLGARNRAHAVALALLHGLIRHEDAAG